MNLAPGLYRHFKGSRYIVLGIARHSETLEPVVVYKSENDESLWVRPLEMFTEHVERDNYSGPRFRFEG